MNFIIKVDESCLQVSSNGYIVTDEEEGLGEGVAVSRERDGLRNRRRNMER